MTSTTREGRLEKIKKIQESRGSKVLIYLTSDRPGFIAGQIGTDSIRPMFDHIRFLANSKVDKLDLLLYSRGGSVETPWPLINMCREFFKKVNVIIPYRAHSATTLIALGADEILMSKKAEMGPIDPMLTKIPTGESQNQRTQPEVVNVEDVMAYISFLKDKAGLSDQSALSQSVGILAEKLGPLTLGSIYREHSHIRLIARKLLLSHEGLAIEEHKINTIIENLAEKMFFHGHAISRKEATEIGLPVKYPDDQLETDIWDLFESYEDLLKLNIPLDFIGHDFSKSDFTEEVIIALIESEYCTTGFKGTFRSKAIKQMPPQLNLNLNLNLQLPPNLQTDQLPQAIQQLLQKMLQDLQKNAQSIITEELNKQAPISGYKPTLEHAYWKKIEGD